MSATTTISETFLETCLEILPGFKPKLWQCSVKSIVPVGYLQVCDVSSLTSPPCTMVWSARLWTQNTSPEPENLLGYAMTGQNIFWDWQDWITRLGSGLDWTELLGLFSGMFLTGQDWTTMQGSTNWLSWLSKKKTFHFSQKCFLENQAQKYQKMCILTEIYFCGAFYHRNKCRSQKQVFVTETSFCHTEISFCHKSKFLSQNQKFVSHY